jgi:hypothetical protein
LHPGSIRGTSLAGFRGSVAIGSLFGGLPTLMKRLLQPLKYVGRLTGNAYWRGFVAISLPATLMILGVSFVSHSTGAGATGWMLIYGYEDFHTLADWATYIANLRVPIPPIISTLEIWSFMATGSPAMVTTHLYRISIVGSYLLALALCYPSRPKVLLSFLVAIPLMWGTVVVHSANPVVYDVFYPFLVLSFIGLLTLLKHPFRAPSRLAILLSCSAGSVLALAELTRPFVLYLMPFLLIGGILVIRPLGRLHIIAFLVPVILTSGLWHLYQAAAHDQVLWTNHTGFNLIRAWPQQWPILVEEPGSAPIAPGRWANLNTPEHLANSRTLQRAVFRHFAEYPSSAAAQALDKLFYFISTPTANYSHTPPPQHALRIYRAVSFVLFLLLFANLLHLLFATLEAPSRLVDLVAEPQNLLIGVALFSFLFLALGEGGEEARLVISVIPMLAALPMATRPATARYPRRRLTVPAMLTCGGALVAASLFVDIWLRRPFDLGAHQWALLIEGVLCIALAVRTQITEPSSQ